MGRKPISPKQRSIPVSFSVKPKLADRIENMAYDQRFTRSKFLTEAVLRYINYLEMGGLDGSDNVEEMSLNRRVVIGATALQEANRDHELVSESMIKLLKDALEVYELRALLHNIDEKTEATKQALQVHPDADIYFEKVPNQSEYQIFNHGTNVGTIVKGKTNDHKGKWIVDDIHGFTNAYRTLKDAKAAVLEEWE